MQTISSRFFWAPVVMLISNDDKHYTTSILFKKKIYNKINDKQMKWKQEFIVTIL